MKNQTKRKVKAKPKRKVRSSFIAIISIFLLSVFAILSVTVLFPVENVKIKDAEKTKYSQNEIISASGIRIGENMIVLSSSSVESRITEALPYIGSCKIGKSLVGTITLTPKATKPQYCIKDGEAYWLVNDEFKALEKIKKAKRKYINITGAKFKEVAVGKTIEFKDGDKLDCINTVLDILDESNITINKINVKNLSSLEITVNSKFKVKVGTVQSLEKKLLYLLEMIKEIEKKNEKDTGTINLVYFDKTKEGIFKREAIE